jgi:phosphoenolpyruvate synthase/pyruvate phosphate dikinase
MGFAEQVNEMEGLYQVTSAFHYIEQIIMRININEEVKDEIPE